MDNVNIRYECLDANDDFHARKHKGGIGIGSWDDHDTEAMQGLGEAADIHWYTVASE